MSPGPNETRDINFRIQKTQVETQPAKADLPLVAPVTVVVIASTVAVDGVVVTAPSRRATVVVVPSAVVVVVPPAVIVTVVPPAVVVVVPTAVIVTVVPPAVVVVVPTAVIVTVVPPAVTAVVVPPAVDVVVVVVVVVVVPSAVVAVPAINTIFTRGILCVAIACRQSSSVRTHARTAANPADSAEACADVGVSSKLGVSFMAEASSVCVCSRGACACACACACTCPHIFRPSNSGPHVKPGIAADERRDFPLPIFTDLCGGAEKQQRSQPRSHNNIERAWTCCCVCNWTRTLMDSARKQISAVLCRHLLCFSALRG